MSECAYKIYSFRPSDGVGVAQLFREVYGDGYPVKIVYNSEQLVTAFENNEYIPVVARTPDNRIVGFSSLYRSAPHKGVYETGDYTDHYNNKRPHQYLWNFTPAYVHIDVLSIY